MCAIRVNPASMVEAMHKVRMRLERFGVQSQAIRAESAAMVRRKAVPPAVVMGCYQPRWRRKLGIHRRDDR